MSCNSDEIAISVKNLTKVYKIFETPGKRFLYHMFHTNTGRDFVALDNINFEVKGGRLLELLAEMVAGKVLCFKFWRGL